MTDNINEVMDRLSALDEIHPRPHPDDLKALLSYTKQCREDLEAIDRDTDDALKDYPDNDNAAKVWFKGSVRRSNRIARQALSTQPGERE